ncbi:hypothetical protein ASE63_07000 [Bosea sp. Root381]|nr:hypothetical protein ASE63_07000 [Bosea sp. Root381]
MLAFASQAQAMDWNGTWVGRLDTGASVAVVIEGGRVTTYRFSGRSVSIAYSSVSPDRVTFSPGSAAIVELKPAAGDKVDYSFTHPQRGAGTGVLSRATSHRAVASSAAARIPASWSGRWGRPERMMLVIGDAGITYSYRGHTYPATAIRATAKTLSFRVGDGGSMSMKMRADGAADFDFVLDGKSVNGFFRRNGES